jgi:hypothetical protein
MPDVAREVEVEVLPKGAGGGGRYPRGGKDDPLMALIARLMDTLFRIPGTNIRFGLDPLIGLIPAVGSPISAFVSLLMIARSAQQGVPNVVLARMAGNVLINAILDAIPGIGDALSIFYRSNSKNHELLRQYAGTRRAPTRGDRLFVFGLMAGVIVLVVLIIVGALVVAHGIWKFVTGS